jgi:hypothetical protein
VRCSLGLDCARAKEIDQRTLDLCLQRLYSQSMSTTTDFDPRPLAHPSENDGLTREDFCPCCGNHLDDAHAVGCAYEPIEGDVLDAYVEALVAEYGGAE